MGSEIELVDVQTKQGVGRLVQVGGRIYDVVFSPDGAFLAAACQDRNVRIWRVADQELIAAIPQKDPLIFHRRMGFTPDGKHLIVTQGCEECPDGHFALFILWRPEDVLQEACRRAIRKKLTLAEWQQFLPGQPYRETCGD